MEGNVATAAYRVRTTSCRAFLEATLAKCQIFVGASRVKVDLSAYGFLCEGPPSELNMDFLRDSLFTLFDRYDCDDPELRCIAMYLVYTVTITAKYPDQPALGA
jgi:hypothetical protein